MIYTVYDPDGGEHNEEWPPGPRYVVLVRNALEWLPFGWFTTPEAANRAFVTLVRDGVPNLRIHIVAVQEDQ